MTYSGNSKPWQKLRKLKIKIKNQRHVEYNLTTQNKGFYLQTTFSFKRQQQSNITYIWLVKLQITRLHKKYNISSGIT